MRVDFGGWVLQKTEKPETDLVYPIKFVANSLQEDHEGQMLLKKAFDDQTVENFLKCGVIDWLHQSKLGETEIERVDAIMGAPTDFIWENDLPVVHANLTKGNAYVDSIIPHLRAGQPIFGASVGGGILDKEPIRKAGRPIDAIRRIIWDHAALARTAHTISDGTAVSLRKAKVGDSMEMSVSFDTAKAMIDHWEQVYEPENMIKAVMAEENVTDSSKKQDLGAGQYDAYTVIKACAEKFKKGEIPPNVASIKDYLLKSGVALDDLDDGVKNVHGVLKLLGGKK